MLVFKNYYELIMRRKITLYTPLGQKYSVTLKEWLWKSKNISTEIEMTNWEVCALLYTFICYVTTFILYFFVQF